MGVQKDTENIVDGAPKQRENRNKMSTFISNQKMASEISRRYNEKGGLGEVQTHRAYRKKEEQYKQELP